MGMEPWSDHGEKARSLNVPTRAAFNPQLFYSTAHKTALGVPQMGTHPTTNQAQHALTSRGNWYFLTMWHETVAAF